MTKHKHTPGPWEALNETEVFTGLGADSGDGVKALPTDGWMIADCGDAMTFTEVGLVELALDVRRANARLIAQAPNLLADLVEAAAQLRKYETLHRAKATTDSLAKAEVNAELASRFEQTIAQATA
ncbi:MULTISPECIES: hypothetical protein [unclassified Pseudomonas]|jgi:hypothetical protein|uniref:hypothetical protein n=1 Tax=unclassified Pseudomonas TaxID=196821 RepID=UPI000B59366B|nr:MULTISPECIES: hypothetical protein [unclassified Pseudomonas]OWQ33341.1 hypothetical protein CC207_25260 [Pseudomonas sp. DrBHI1]QWA30461.1 hypothetical protein KHO27_06155 [Pseudomonas sp. RC3H12]